MPTFSTPAAGVSRPASPERGRSSGTSVGSDALLTTGAPRAGGTAERESFSTEFVGNPQAAVQSAVLRASMDPSNGFGMAGVSTAGSEFSIDGIEEMQIYGSGFGGSGRCAFLRVNKLCYAAVGVLVAGAVLLGVLLDQQAPQVHDAVQHAAAASGVTPPPPPSGPEPVPSPPTPDPSPGPATMCTKGTKIKYASSPECLEKQVGGICPYTCPHGYVPAGAHVCDEDGTFRGGSCTFAGCQGKDPIAHTASDCGASGAYGDTCDVSCSAGYTDVPGKPGSVHTFVCAVGGEWKAISGPINCTNIDECSADDNVCPDGKICIDTMGSYDCSACQPPLVDDGDGGCMEPPATSCTKGMVNIPHSSRANIPCTGSDPGVSECAYSCDLGYTRTGDHKCDASGTWSGGSCDPNPCRRGATIPHSNRNDEISNNACTGSTGDQCQFTCDEGFVPHGEHMCHANGTWSGGSCISGTCRHPLTHSIDHSEVVPGACPSQGQNGQLYDVCNVTCQKGFHAVGSGQYECTGSQWTAVGQATTCEDIDECAESNSPCVAIHEVCVNTDGGHSCGECQAGYHDSGKVSISGSHCVGDACPPHKIEHQKASDPQCSGTMGTQCQYKCEPGYTARGHLRCSPGTGQSGQWLGGECVPNACNSGLTIPNSNRIPSNKCQGAVGEECTYTCDAGYAKTPGAAGKHICQVSGTFTGGACTAMHCPVDGLSYDNTDVVYSHSHRPGEVSTQIAYVTCRTGFTPTKVEMTVATADSEHAYAFTCNGDHWSPQFSQLIPQTNGNLCTAVDCKSFTVAHGSVSTPSGTVYRSDMDVVATTLCDDGYTASYSMPFTSYGDKTRTCGADGKWTGRAPTCIANARCSVPITPQNGRVSLSSPTTATYRCNPTFVLHGANHDGSSDSCDATDASCGTRRCVHGQWEGPNPTCDAADSTASTTCDPLPTIQHGTIQQSNRNGGMATVTCVNGARIAGTMDYTMQMHCEKGDWEPPLPVCRLDGR